MSSENDNGLETIFNPSDACEKDRLGAKEIKALFKQLKNSGTCADSQFDQIFPKSYQRLSEIQWTSVSVAGKAAALATQGQSRRVLDVGSGVGKFCIVGALTTKGFFTGVEQRSQLCDVAIRAACEFQIPRINFIHGNMTEIDWDIYDSYYLFNPFAEHLDGAIRIDGGIIFSPFIFFEYTKFVCEKLQSLEPGKTVVIFNGFGADFPEGFERFYKDDFNFMKLEAWKKL